MLQESQVMVASRFLLLSIALSTAPCFLAVALVFLMLNPSYHIASHHIVWHGVIRRCRILRV